MYKHIKVVSYLGYLISLHPEEPTTSTPCTHVRCSFSFKIEGMHHDAPDPSNSCILQRKGTVSCIPKLSTGIDSTPIGAGRIIDRWCSLFLIGPRGLKSTTTCLIRGNELGLEKDLDIERTS